LQPTAGDRSRNPTTFQIRAMKEWHYAHSALRGRCARLPRVISAAYQPARLARSITDFPSPLLSLPAAIIGSARIQARNLGRGTAVSLEKSGDLSRGVIAGILRSRWRHPRFPRIGASQSDVSAISSIFV